MPGSANPFLQRYYAGKDVDGRDAIFSFFDLDSDELIDVPDALVPTYHLQGGADPRQWQTLGVKVEVFRNYQEREAFAARHDVTTLKTCTPYLAGNVPARGEHCAWMESSAVIFANPVLGARTNTEGRGSTSAAMLTGKIPDWGLHRTECRFGTHRIDVQVPVDSVMNRLEVTGINSGDKNMDKALWEVWQANSMDAESKLAFNASLVAGRSFALVWPDENGQPEISLDNSSQMAIMYAPGSRRKRQAAMRYWTEGDQSYATLYRPEAIYKYIGPEGEGSKSVANVKWEKRDDEDEEWPLPNPYNVVTAVEIKDRHAADTARTQRFSWRYACERL